MSTPQRLELIVSSLRDLSKIKQLGLSIAADTAAKLSAEAKNVKTDKEIFEQTATDSCFLVFVVADRQKEKGQKAIDANLKSNLEDVARVYGEILELAKSNSALNDLVAFWHSDSDNLENLNKKLSECLTKLNIQSLSDLRAEADRRVEALAGSSGSTPTANTSNSSHNQSHTNNGIDQRDNGTVQQHNGIAQRDNGRVYSGNHYGPQMFNHASGFSLQGGEFNNVGGDCTKTSYNAKNLSTNYGQVYGQNNGDNAAVNFNALPR